tara:strand:- start:219 stop:455 length:237 start_codon:yes stop_codon:yes gene_type:complete
MVDIEIYSKDNCPFCDKAVRLAQQLVQEAPNKYAVYKLGVDFEMEDMMKNFPNARTFPQITINGKSIGGYTEFEQMFR